MLSIHTIVRIPPENVYIDVTTPINNTETGSDHPVMTWTITAVAKNRIPSANTLVTRNIRDADF